MNNSFDLDDNSLFITQEPVPGKSESDGVQDDRPNFDLDLEPLLDTTDDSGNISVASLDKSFGSEEFDCVSETSKIVSSQQESTSLY